MQPADCQHSPAPAPPRLLLASGSRYRAELLRRLGLSFTQQVPEIDETPAAAESPEALALRLAVQKAAAVAGRFPGAWVLGSDQVADCEGRRLGKPGDHRRAVEQLSWLSGRDARFTTAVCLIAGDGQPRTALDVTIARLRRLGDDEIDRYLRQDRPYDCAGSFKVEALGITLFDAVESQDPTALIGLPLIAVRRLLAEAGWLLP